MLFVISFFGGEGYFVIFESLILSDRNKTTYKYQLRCLDQTLFIDQNKNLIPFHKELTEGKTCIVQPLYYGHLCACTILIVIEE